MNLFSYIVASDSGFAPNPFWGYCTLACCKPAIRRTATVGDLIVGLTPKAGGHKIVYIMRITRRMTFAEYWNARGFRRKKPDCQGSERQQLGDNIYCPVTNGTFVQQKSRHSEQDKDWDLRGGFVLASDDFVYFGAEAIDLPKRFSRLIVGRGHRKLTPEASAQDAHFIATFNDWFAQLPRGRCGMPRKWLGRQGRCDGSMARSACKR